MYVIDVVGDPVLFINDNWNLLIPILEGLLFVVYVASTEPPTTLNSYSVAPVTDVEYKFVLAWVMVVPHWDPMISGWVDFGWVNLVTRRLWNHWFCSC